MTNLPGQLLVATSVIEGEPFFRSVIYLLDSDEHGAVGIILNYPLDPNIDELFPQWSESVDRPGTLYLGGPVDTQSAMAVGIAREGTTPAGWQSANGRIGIVDLDGPVPSFGDFACLRLYAGYAGWSAGQLEAEIAEGSWLVVPALESDLQHADTSTLWREVLARQTGDTRFWATLPDQLADN